MFKAKISQRNIRKSEVNEKLSSVALSEITGIKVSLQTCEISLSEKLSERIKVACAGR